MKGLHPNASTNQRDPYASLHEALKVKEQYEWINAQCNNKPKAQQLKRDFMQFESAIAQEMDF